MWLLNRLEITASVGNSRTTYGEKPNGKKSILRAGFEPATYGFLLYRQLQSTALPTELSKVLFIAGESGVFTRNA